jgi:hypothetical protein
MKPRKNFAVSPAMDEYGAFVVLEERRESAQLDEAYAEVINTALASSRKPLRFVATSRDMGMDVRFYTDALEYARAVKIAMAEHKSGNVDQYLHGDCKP